LFSTLSNTIAGQDLLLQSSSGTYTGKIQILTGDPEYGEAGDIEVSGGLAGKDRKGDSRLSGSISLSTSSAPSTNNGDSGE
jgi:hypothetical protein